jgi:MFS family permease
MSTLIRQTSDRSRYKNYLLILLMVILAFNYVDRMALGIVLQDIKTDLDLTDTQLGLLSGIAFALFYSTMGIPIARWADRGNRVTIISLTTALWSAAVALCGSATSFMQLLAIRVGVAIGEAGCIPPAHSLIADYFTRAERPRAVARYMLGVPLALTIGYFAAGWLNEILGWRKTFVILGLPGLVLAVLGWFTLKEPRRTRNATAVVPAAASAEVPSPPLQPSLREVCVTLWANAAFRHLLFCFSVWYFFGYGLLQWQPAFFIRSHGLQTGELGTWFAVVYGVGGGLGVYLGGELAARYAAGNERLQLNACAVAFVFFAVLNACAYLASDHYWAFGALALGALGGNMAQGPILATIQTLVPPRMRAMSIALVYLFSNLIGMGLGPLAAGALSDALRPLFGEESLRYALLMLCPGYFWAAWHLWRASRTVVRDLKAAQALDAAGATPPTKLAFAEQ